MFYIKEARPEQTYKPDGFEYTWNEGGMADLFSECYKNETRLRKKAGTPIWMVHGEKILSRTMFPAKFESFAISWLCIGVRLKTMA